jgi:hypothetical protein
MQRVPLHYIDTPSVDYAYTLITGHGDWRMIE